MAGHDSLLEVFRAADDFVEASDAEGGEVMADFFGDGVEEVDDVFFFAFEFGAQVIALSGYADGASIEVALAHVDAAEGDEGDGTEVVFFGAEDGGVDDIETGAQTAIGPKSYAAAQIIEHQYLLGLGESEFPWQAGVFDGRNRGGPGSAFVTGDEDNVGIGFGDAGGDGADACFCDQFDADAGAGIDLFEVMDELRQVLDGVDIVVGRRRDELNAGLGAAQARDQAIDLVAGELSALAGFSALSHFDLNFLGAGEVFCGDPEAARGDLFDLGIEP